MALSFRNIRQLVSKSLAFTAALCVLVGTTYVPMPGVIQKDYSVPFPCMDKPCDCRSADDCWASCCCHSDDEKLAWAEKHCISPPEWFLDGMRRTGHGSLAKSSGSCCATKQPSCCQVQKTPAPNTCCANEPQPRNSKHARTQKNTKSQSVAVCVKQQRKCKGHDGIFHLDLLFVELTEPSPELDRSNPSYRLFDVPGGSIDFPPPTPPPRRM